MNTVPDHESTEGSRRTRGHTVGAKSFAQRQRVLQTQLGRIDTSSHSGAHSVSPTTTQRPNAHKPSHVTNHSRQHSSTTEKSSLHTQDSGFSSGTIGSPGLYPTDLDAALPPPSIFATHVSPTPSPPHHPSKGDVRREHSISPHPIQLPISHRPSRSRQPSRARNETLAVVNERGGANDTVADFALEHLFASFVKDADKKIESLSSSVAKSRISDHIEDVCGLGVDAAFDKLLVAMGHVARKHPEPLVEKIIHWKIMHDRAATSAASGDGSFSVTNNKRSDEASRIHTDNNANEVPMSRPDVAMSDRRASAATYMMCRALTELVSRTTLPALTTRVAVRLGDIAFDYNVNRPTNDELKKSPLQLAKWEKATDVLGVLSRIDFGNVCGRYLSVLRQCHQFLNERGTADAETVSKIRIMLKGMRKLRPQGDETKYFIEYSSCMGDFISLFSDVHGEEIKIQYCRTLEPLLLRLARDVEANFEDNKWRKNVATLQERLNKLMSKPKYRDAAYPALVALACVSPKDMFAVRWQSLPSTLSTRLREHRHRGPVLKGACRLVWTYLRKSATLDATCRTTFDEVVKMIFFSRKYALSRDTYITEPLIQFIRTVAQFDAQFAFKSIIFPLVQIELFNSSSNRDPHYQSLDPDKIIIGIQAFLAVISDVETGQALAFPIGFPDETDATAEDFSQVPLSPSANDHWPQSRRGLQAKSERLSRPVASHQLPHTIKESYTKFCELLSQILRVCDDAFGGQVSINEKMASPNTGRTPNFVDTWTFARKDDDEHQAERTGKFGYLDLLHMSVQAIPRCLSEHTPIKNVVDLLCTGTAHTERDIAVSSAVSLKSIAGQGFADFIVSRFSFFIFRYDNRYSTIADGGLLGPSHIESTLRLWVELLNIWENELLRKTKDSAAESTRLDTSNIMTHVDRVEAMGLFLICSPSANVRSYAVEVLSIVTRLDKALSTSVTRVYEILTSTATTFFPRILDGRLNSFSNMEKAKLEKIARANNVNDTLVKLCGSGVRDDVELWYKLFPSFVHVFFEVCPTSVVQTREDVCNRLAQLHTQIDAPTEERSRAPTVGSMDSSTNRTMPRVQASPPHALIEQYKLYLIFACSTIQRQDSLAQSNAQDVVHTRKSSRSSAGGHDSFDSAQDLFSKIVPMVYNESVDLRQVAVAGLSSINPTLYHLLLQSFDMQSRSLPHDLRAQYIHSRSASSPRRNDLHPLFRQELVCIYESTSRFLLEPDLHYDDWVMHHLSEFTWSLYEYLRQDETQTETRSIKNLRSYYCGLIQNFYLGVLRSSTPSRWMPFAKRKAHFIRIEEWFIEVTPSDRRALVNGMPSPRGRRTFNHHDRTAALDDERLRTASSSAMATLCAGPYQSTKPEPDEQFNVLRLLAWTDRLLELQGDKPQATGKRALVNLVSHNKQVPAILESIIAKLFKLEKRATIETYLDVLLDIFTQQDPPRVREYNLLGALLFTLGHEESSIRMKSARLIRIYEESRQHQSNLRSHDIGISDRTTAVHKRAHFDISNELLLHHRQSSFACALFSVYAEHFPNMPPDAQRIMVLVLLPWMPIIQLEKIPQIGYTGSTYMVLLNLVYITLQCVNGLQNEIQALWQALILEPQSDNAGCILDFIIDLSLEKRDSRYLRTAKQIIVFLATAPSNSSVGVIDLFLQRIEPKSMNPTAPLTSLQKPDSTSDFPFVIDASQVFPETAPIMRLSMGQLSLILLVDLVISEDAISPAKLPELLLLILVLWDHHSQIVQEQAREMLVHLVHVFVISRATNAVISGRTPSIEELVGLIRRQDPKVGWAYHDNSDPTGPDQPPAAMTYVIQETVALFSTSVPKVSEQLGRMALKWALECPVRHIACRSLQIYRLILQPLGHPELSEILGRSSSTLADQASEYQCYAVDVLRTIHAIVKDLPAESSLLPRVFWATCAALETVHEWEYAEALSTLSDILDKCDLRYESAVAYITDSKPPQWDCNVLTAFVPSLYRGYSSSVNYDQTVDVINHAMRIGCQPIFKDESCLKLGILANLPHLLRSYEYTTRLQARTTRAIILRDCCNIMGQESLAHQFQGFATSILSQSAFFSACVTVMNQDLFKVLTYNETEFLMRQLLNPEPRLRYWTLKIIQEVIPRIDRDDAKIQICVLDLFSPLVTLLSTELSTDAIKVIDAILPLTGVSNDLLQLRRAHVPPDPIHLSSKPPSEMGGFYGEITQTGWAFLNPATHNKRPRSRINAVAMQQPEETHEPSRPTTLTPEVEFHKEEVLQDSYFPADILDCGASDVPDSACTNITDLTAQLDDLDDFFEDNASEAAIESETLFNATARPPPKAYARPLHQSKPSINYQTPARSHRKLESSTSFASDIQNTSINASPALPPQKSFHPPPPPMSPSAFASPPSSEQNMSVRPGMPPRAFTMPVHNIQTPETLLSKPSPDPESFSDDDLAGVRTHLDRTDSGTASRSTTPQKPFSSLRNSIKRLTSGGDRHRRTNTKAQAVESSPQVPPVPNEYLHMPMSSDM